MEKEIALTDIQGLRIGQAENVVAGTGCTVLACEQGMAAGLDVRGGGPASRESELLKPTAAAQCLHTVVLAGGSAFGLGAANGVMDYLEEHGIGFDVGVTKVPLVAQSDIFDLTVGDVHVRPDRAMGYEACRRAFEEPNYKDGNFGVGCGATVGKLCGMETCMKSGIGSYAISLGDLQIGAIVCVNALGDVYDWKTGKKIAGLLSADRRSFRDSVAVMKESIAVHENRFTSLESAQPSNDRVAQQLAKLEAASQLPTTNTTIGAVITNAAFTKTQLCKIAGMAHNGFARSIRPVHTSADGDSIYALSVGTVSTDLELVGTLAAEVMSEAITRAVKSAESAYGFVAAKDLPQ